MASHTRFKRHRLRSVGLGCFVAVRRLVGVCDGAHGRGQQLWLVVWAVDCGFGGNWNQIRRRHPARALAKAPHPPPALGLGQHLDQVVCLETQLAGVVRVERLVGAVKLGGGRLWRDGDVAAGA